MRINLSRVVVAVLLFSVAPLAGHAQCVSTLRNVAQVNEFPNRPAANVAWSGTVHGVVKVEPQTRSNPIYFGIADADLNPTTADRLIVDTTLGGPVALVSNGSEFALFYQSLVNQLYLQRLDLAGNTIGGPIAILPNRPQLEGMEYDIAWNPVIGAYAILHTIPSSFDKGIYLTTVSPNGTVLIDRLLTFFLTNDHFVTPRLAITTNGSMGVLWRRDDGYWFSLHPPAVDIVSPQKVTTTGASPVLGSNGSTFLVVLKSPGSGNPELHEVAIDAAGVPGAEKNLIVAKGNDIVPISMVWNPVLKDYGMVYVDAINGLGNFPTETRLRRLGSTGTTLTDTLFSPDTTKFDYATRAPVIFNGSAYIGAIERFRSNFEGSEAYLVRHCPLRVLLAADQGANVSPNTTLTLRATAFGGFPGYTYFWDFGDLVQTGGGATITHKYDRLGTYVVTVTAKDTQGASQSATFAVTVARQKPRAIKR
jgi:hypothetical protein